LRARDQAIAAARERGGQAWGRITEMLADDRRFGRRKPRPWWAAVSAAGLAATVNGPEDAVPENLTPGGPARLTIVLASQHYLAALPGATRTRAQAPTGQARAYTSARAPVDAGDSVLPHGAATGAGLPGSELADGSTESHTTTVSAGQPQDAGRGADTAADALVDPSYSAHSAQTAAGAGGGRGGGPAGRG
jgi:hypothetical protein